MCKVKSLHGADDRGGLAVTLPAELDVAREVVNVRARGRGTLNAEGGQRGRIRDNQLDLAEYAARRYERLAQVTELARTRAVDGGGIASAEGDAARVAGRSSNNVHGPASRG